jgi:hypothetical protein
MKKATTTTTLSEPGAKFMHAILQAMAEYDHEERLRSRRASREWRKAATNRREDV